ncbi:MAG TPA: 16S rRNA (guanine(527)-N(7))-methyltransferase RsmG [Candidatus Limnocylindrales bacterium]|nr:16S rRNA (guanine(527)-N(7))-methyltransferase RsmG [Candidatus Limnocylindrales bacterium]
MGRGQRNGSESFGHGRHSDRSSLLRRNTLPDSPAELPELPAEFWRTLEDGLLLLDLTLSPPARAAIDAHVRLLVAWNEQINLTGLRTPQQIARHNVFDALLALPLMSGWKGAKSLIDIGSGGGFPGLPLALTLPLERVALVDSIGKKQRFLSVASVAATDALRTAGAEPPQIAALAARAESLAADPEQRETWDVMTSRAVGSVAEVAELGLPLIRRGGRVVAWKRDAGDGSLQREVADARRIVQACGGVPPRIVALPRAAAVGLDGHCLVVIAKARPTPERYPRDPAERRRSS